MSSRGKMDKKSKAIFTIITDRLCEDSAEECYGKDLLKQDNIDLQSFQFPLDYQLQQIHELPHTTQLSAYIKHLQSQVKNISNKIQLEYHQARQTVHFIGQTTNLSKFVSRKKIDDQFHKMGIIRKYDPKNKIKNTITLDDQEDLAQDAGDIALSQIKRKVQLQWESQISDQMEKERKRLRQLEKKKQKEIEQIDKDFQKIMKKRKVIRDAQIQLKSQQSMKSLKNVESSQNKTPKKIQKRQKIERRASQRNKERNGIESQEKSIIGSQIQSCSAMNNQNQEISINENGNMLESEENLKINLLQHSNSNQWNHENIDKPDIVMESNQLHHDQENVQEF